MDYRLFFHFKRIVNFIIFNLLMTLTYSSVSFNFPYSLTLSNGDIFVIHQTGVSICDNHLSEIKQNVISFPENKEIKTESSLSKISTIFENNYIICIINDKIYIFDEFGTSIYNSTSTITNFEEAEYYTLVPITKNNYYYTYVVGYIYNNLLYLLYYKYEFSRKINNLLNIKRGIKHESYDNYDNYIGSFYIEYKGLSCQYMNYDTLFTMFIRYILLDHVLFKF